MTVKTRKYVALAVTVLIGVVYGQLAGGWSDLEYYGGAAALLVVIAGVALPWMEYAPDGAFRKHPRT
jgi:hypothetical protein